MQASRATKVVSLLLHRTKPILVKRRRNLARRVQARPLLRGAGILSRHLYQGIFGLYWVYFAWSIFLRLFWGCRSRQDLLELSQLKLASHLFGLSTGEVWLQLLEDTCAAVTRRLMQRLLIFVDTCCSAVPARLYCSVETMTG